MTPTKLLIGQIFVVFAIVIAGVWAATQWCAAMLGYQPELGAAWFRIGELPVYRPWAIFWWWYSYEAYAPQVFDNAGALAGGSGFVGCAAAIAGSLWRARQSRHVTTYGSARWATPRELGQAGLHNDAGVYRMEAGDDGGVGKTRRARHNMPRRSGQQRAAYPSLRGSGRRQLRRIGRVAICRSATAARSCEAAGRCGRLALAR